MNLDLYDKGFVCVSVIAVSGLLFPGCTVPMLVGASLAFWLLHREERLCTSCGNHTRRQSQFGNMGGRSLDTATA